MVAAPQWRSRVICATTTTIVQQAKERYGTTHQSFSIDVLMLTRFGTIDPNIHYEWNPLWQMSDDEKSKSLLLKLETTQFYATIGIINSDALREGLVNQLIEDGTYPGFDDAIEEFGSEPEMDDETGGYIQPNGMPALNPARMAIEEQKTER